ASVKTYGGKTNWQWKDTGHRASGTLAFLTSGAAVIYGLYSGWGRANLGPQRQLIASVRISLLHITTVIYLLSSKKQTTKVGFSTVGFHRGLEAQISELCSCL
ncbi:hypothetical protein AeNC1_009142, partial [Aphanomyces euteiches]